MRIICEDRAVDIADGTRVELRTPTYAEIDLVDGPLRPKTMISPRVAPQMIRLGLPDAIAANDILANEASIIRTTTGFPKKRTRFGV